MANDMFESPEEINKVIAEKEGDMSLLQQRMEGDWDLLALTAYEPKGPNNVVRKGYESYTSSAPRNFFDKVLDGLNRAGLNIQIKLPEDAKEKERQRAIKGEQFLQGALDAIDRRLARQVQPPLRQGLGHFICSRGWMALRALVYVPEGQEKAIFDVRPLDPLHLLWEEGIDGLVWAAYRRSATKAQIEAEHGLTIEGRDAIVTDFWTPMHNAVLVAATFAKEPLEHGVGHVPIYIGAVGSMPTTLRSNSYGTRGAEAQSSSLATLEMRGDSVWTASRNLYEPRNKYASWILDKARKGVAGSLVHESPKGDKKLVGDPFESYIEIPVETGERIYPLESADLPPEFPAVMAIIDQDIQASTLPYPLAYGGTREALSGRALAFLAEGTKSVFSPRTSALEQAYRWLCDELIAQFAEKGTSDMSLAGHLPDESFFQVKVSPKDVDPDWYVSVNVEPKLPRDEEAEIMMALAATQRRAPDDIPLVSKQTAREKILKLPDPLAEETKVLAEIGKAHPVVMASRIAAKMKAVGDDEGAELMVEWIASQGGRGTPESPGGPEGNGPPQAQGEFGQPGAAEPQVDPAAALELTIQALVAAGQEELARAVLQALSQQIRGGSAPTQ